MGMELWPRVARLRQNEGKYRNLTGLKMNRQFEPIRKQRLNHLTKLGFGRIATGARLDVKPVRE